MSEPKGRKFLRGARADLLGAGRGRRQFSPVACFFHPLFLAGSKNRGTQNDRSGQFALVQTFLYGLVKDFRMSTSRERLDSWGVYVCVVVNLTSTTPPKGKRLSTFLL